MIKNGRIIAVNYSPGAGGNFVQNCLGFSRHCVLRDQKYVDWQLTAAVDADFYRQKLAWVLETIPPDVIDHNWINYELGSHRLFGFKLSEEHTDQDIPQVVHHAAEQGLWITHGAHSHPYTSHFTRHWPEVKYINVVAWAWARQWREIKKTNLTSSDNKKHLGVWQASPDAYDFDLDSAIESESKWLQNIQALYQWLEWDDFDQAPVAEYYRAYRQAHAQ
jgi:hypothetical protein